jgi:hypothetical protein
MINNTKPSSPLRIEPGTSHMLIGIVKESAAAFYELCIIVYCYELLMIAV